MMMMTIAMMMMVMTMAMMMMVITKFPFSALNGRVLRSRLK